MGVEATAPMNRLGRPAVPLEGRRIGRRCRAIGGSMNQIQIRWRTLASVLTAFFALIALSALPAGAAELQARPPGGYTRTNLVSDVPGAAQLTDPNLVNAWGM